MRRLGVYGENLPTKKERSVEPADFSIAGLIGYFDRQYNVPFRLRSDIEGKTVFGEQTNRNYYGWDCLNGFFSNLKGAPGSIYVYSPVGKGAVQASLGVLDGNKEVTILIKAAYLGEDEYGEFANRTGVKIEQGAFFESAIVSSDGKIYSLESVSGLHVGDIVKVGDAWSSVEAISESARSVTLADELKGDTLLGMGFKLKTYRKSLNGLVDEVDKTLGEIWCTLNPNDPDHFAPQVFQQSSYVRVEAQTTNPSTDPITEAKKASATAGSLKFTALKAGAAGNSISVAVAQTTEQTGELVTADITAYDKDALTVTADIEVVAGDEVKVASEDSSFTAHVVSVADGVITLDQWSEEDFEPTIISHDTRASKAHYDITVLQSGAEVAIKSFDALADVADLPLVAVEHITGEEELGTFALTGGEDAVYPTTVPSLPVDQEGYLSGGTRGDVEWDFHVLDPYPIRMLALCESANDSLQSSLEQYCRSREDNPIAVLVPQYNMLTKERMIQAGNFFQRSDEVDALYVANWLGVPDPFSTSPAAPDREVPPVGHVMGLWIYSIQQNGIHSTPARKNCSLSNVNSVIGYTADKDQDRTDLADAGVNVIQKVTGKGFLLRNAFTPSTAAEWRYANAVIQRNFIKISVVDSLQDSENTPNTMPNVREDRMATLQFMHKMWRSGSNGSTREGEFFGQYEKDDGSLSTVEDAFEVVADATNNSVQTLQAGERNIDIWFMFPAPAGSIKVGVGLIYKVAA